MKKQKATDALKTLWDELDKSNVTAPPNAITIHDYMVRYKVTLNVAAYQLERDVRSGKLKRGTFRTAAGKSQRHYWLAGDK